MPDGFTKIATPKLSTADLVDAIALQDMIKAEAEKARKELVSELLARVSDEHYIDGHLFTATVVAEGIVWSLDSERIKEQMGAAWVAKYSKHSLRKKYIKVTARKERT